MHLEAFTAKHPLLSKLHKKARMIRRNLRGYIALAKITVASRLPYKQKKHSLPQEVIVSLTSYTPRFKTLHLTLECLLRQTVKPDRVIFWTNETDMPNLPEKIVKLKDRGLEIRTTPRNCGPFNKIVHTLMAHPDAVIITTDDDNYYQADLVENLIGKWSGNSKEIVCNQAVWIGVDGNGAKTSYNAWKIAHEETGPRYDIMSVGCSGVLYPPGCFAPEVTDMDLYMDLAPRADDLWLYWMARRNGCAYQRVSGHQWIVSWPETQKVALKHGNHENNGNDIQAANLERQFGWPSLERA